MYSPPCIFRGLLVLSRNTICFFEGTHEARPSLRGSPPNRRDDHFPICLSSQKQFIVNRCPQSFLLSSKKRVYDVLHRRDIWSIFTAFPPGTKGSRVGRDAACYKLDSVGIHSLVGKIAPVMHCHAYVHLRRLPRRGSRHLLSYTTERVNFPF